MAAATLLAYNLDHFTLERLGAICAAQGFRLREVTPEEYALPIGALAGIPIRRAAQAESIDRFNVPMLVMCGMLADQLNAFLSALKEAGIRIPLKAVLTPSNVAWTSSALHAALSSEHAQIHRPNT